MSPPRLSGLQKLLVAHIEREGGRHVYLSGATRVPVDSGLLGYSWEGVNLSLKALVRRGVLTASRNTSARPAVEPPAREPGSFISRWTQAIKEMPSTYVHPAAEPPVGRATPKIENYDTGGAGEVVFYAHGSGACAPTSGCRSSTPGRTAPR